MNRGKVVVIGAGSVGTSVVYSILNQSLCEEIVIIDTNKNKAEGEALDMTHAMEFMSRKTIVRSGEYCDCSDADIIVITASIPMSKNLETEWLYFKKIKR